MKKVLILGGTLFIGRNLVEQLQELGKYDITLFNRQQTNNDLFPSLKKIKGDRKTEEGIQQIQQEDWNYIIDLSCYSPASLTSVLNNLRTAPEKYVFISTCSVYDNEQPNDQLKNENAPLLACTPEQALDPSGATYGNKKAECERILQNANIPYSILRPSLIYGTYDHTDRFYYWLYQVKYKDHILLPDHGTRKFSLTYVHDLVQAIIQAMTEENQKSIYNVTTVPQGSIRELVECAQILLDTNNPLINASPEFLQQRKISEWTDMPLWIDGDYFIYDNRRLQENLGFIPTYFSESVRSTIQYYDHIGWNEPKYGMSNTLNEQLINEVNKGS